MNDFSEVLAELAPTPRRPAMLALAPRLEDALDRTVAIAGRIEAQRLEDRRLEAQRERASAALDGVIAEMSLVADAAAAGDPVEHGRRRGPLCVERRRPPEPDRLTLRPAPARWPSCSRAELPMPSVRAGGDLRGQ